MSTFSACFLGCGRINEKHLALLRALRPGTRLAVASRDPKTAETYARKTGVPRWFGSYDEALDARYDLYVVGTLPSAHHGLVKRIVAAGHHCLVEKPVFSSLEEFQDLWPLLFSSRGLFMVAENLHFAPFQRRLKQVMADPALGRPLMMDLTRLGRSRPKGWRLDPREMPLGALHEGGVHWIRRLLDLASALESDGQSHVLDVMAYSPQPPVTATPHEDTMMVVARHRSGLTTRLLHTWAVPWRFPLFDASKLLCEHGAVYFDARGLYGRSYGPKGRRLLAPNVRDAGGYRAMWQAFVESLETQSPPPLPLRTIYDDFAYMDAAYRSLRSGRPEAPRPPLPESGVTTASVGPSL
ncbi:MAG: Gfo/Idh/MocA family oxidoreductase [Myxococcales bacterium]|nr:Gfo/Idh/MocA family oxidoreductase [Myxococcales bacterium]